MKKGPGKLALVFAALTATALLTSCTSSPGEPEIPKRISYFEVVQFFKTPGKGLADMTYAKQHIWLADEEGAGTIYQIDPNNGSILSSATPSYGAPTAVCTDGTYLYAAHGATGNVYRHGLAPRLVELAHFPTGLADIRGMYFYAGAFYVFDQATRGVYEFNMEWARERLWRIGPGEETIRGFARADGRVWSADWRRGWLNRHRKVNCDVDRKFCTPGWHPAGLAWDGNYLFLGDTGSRRIYKLDLKVEQ